MDRSRRSRRAALLVLSATAIATLGLTAPSAVAAAPRSVSVYVAPNGHGPQHGTRTAPYRSLAAARDGIRSRLDGMRGDVHVVVADGSYRLTTPFRLTAADSGRHGHRVVYEAAPGAHPVVSGGVSIRGWKPFDAGRDIWAAPAPRDLRTRQLYVDGRRAAVASGPAPVALVQTATGYTAAAPTMATWKNPRDIELVYERAPSNWTQSRCRIRSIHDTTITMVQPCWDNTTRRAEDPHTVLARALFNQPLRATPIVTNAFEMLDQPGEWYLDETAHRVYLIPRAGQDLNSVEVVAPKLETLVAGTGTPHRPVHDITMRGITFSHATWLAPSGPNGYSDFQTAQILTGRGAYKKGGDCTKGTSCFFNMLTQVPANVTFDHDRDISFVDDTFTHLGATGLHFGTGSTRATVTGSEFTDTSCAGVSIGRADNPDAPRADRTSETVLTDNWVHAVAVEYQGCPGIAIAYAQHVTVDHNEVNDLPYSGITIGWGGWRERLGNLSPLPNYSRHNAITNNLVFDYMQTLADGGGIYSNGIEGSSLPDGERVSGNVVLQQPDLSWAVYTDNGAEYVNVRDNVVFDVLYFPAAATIFPGVATQFSFGGCSSGPVAFSGNWSIQPDPAKGLVGPEATCGGHPLVGVSSTDNHLIGSLADVPAAMLENAGIRPATKNRLAPTPRPTNLPPYESL